MALQIALEDVTTGVEFTYWRLGSVILLHSRKECRIEIFGFLNKTRYLSHPDQFIARQYTCANVETPTLGENPIQTVNIYDMYFSAEVLNTLNLNPQRQAYIYLKTLPEFANAVDIDVM